ncbi:hypothetical protein WA158_004457 [Blastocystis sp. Blastoise]
MIQSARLNVSNKGLVGVNHRATGHEYRNYIVPGSIPDGEERHPINYSIAPNSLAAVKRIESNMVNRATSNPFYSYLSETRQDVIQSSLEESEETEPIDEGSGLLPDGRIPKNFTRKLIYAHDYVLPYMKQNHMSDYSKYSRLLNPRTIDSAIDFTKRDRDGYLYSRGGNLFSNIYHTVSDVYNVSDKLTGGINNITHGISNAVDYGANKFKDLKNWWRDINVDPQEGFNDIKGKLVSDRNNLYDNWKLTNDNEAKKKNKILADNYFRFAHMSGNDTKEQRLNKKVSLDNQATTFHKNYIPYAENPTFVNKVVNTATNVGTPIVNGVKKVANSVVSGVNNLYNTFSGFLFGKNPEEEIPQTKNPIEANNNVIPTSSSTPDTLTQENIHNITIEDSNPPNLIPLMNDPTVPLPDTVPMSQAVTNNFTPNITPVAPIPNPVENVTLVNNNKRNKNEDDEFQSFDEDDGEVFYDLEEGNGLRRKRRISKNKKLRNKRRKH